MGYQGRGKMIRFEIPVLDAFLLSDALKCATNRHKIKDYADVMQIMNYSKFFESEALKHAEEPPAPPKSDTTITRPSCAKWIYRPGVTLCPNCGWSIEEAWTSKYCPDCGAKMNI